MLFHYIEANIIITHNSVIKINKTTFTVLPLVTDSVGGLEVTPSSSFAAYFYNRFYKLPKLYSYIYSSE